MIFKFFNTKINSFKYVSLFIIILAFSQSVKAELIYSIGDKPTLFQIADKYNEVKLSLTKTTIYMQIKSSVKNYTNQEIEQRHHIEASRFIDSQGHFLLGEIALLNSEVIEYNLDDIELIYDDGKLLFDYHTTQSITFEDILSTDGTPVLQNFTSSDLEQFYLNYKKIIEFSEPISKD